MRFRTKTILGVALIEIGLLVVLIGSALATLRDSNEAELVRRVELGSRLLVAAAKDAVISQDLATLDSLATEVMASGQIEYVRLLDARGAVLVQRGDAAVLARPFHADLRIDQVVDGVFDRSEPVLAGGIRYGEVRMGVSVDPLRVLLASSQRWAAGIAALEIALVALFSWLLGSYLTRQMVALRRASQRYAAGEFGYRVPVHGNDELAQTAQAFNLMAQQLGDSQVLLSRENLLRQQALQDAEKSVNLLREAVSCITHGFTLYDENDRLVLCNEAYLRFYETSRDLIVPGATFEEVVRIGAERGQYSAAIGQVDAWVRQRVRQHQQANGQVLEQRLNDGRWLLIVEHRTPSGHIVGNRIDITGLKLTEALALERAQQIQMVFTLSPDGFVSFDGARRVKYANPAFTQMTGLEEAQVLGLDEADFSQRLAQICLPQAAFPGTAALRAVSASAAEQRPRIELSGPGRRVLEVCLRESELDSVAQILYLRDVTRETEVDQLKSEFLSTAAHELRTPMASIYGFSEVLLTQDLPEAERQEFLAIIFKQSGLMAAILNELLDLARIESRRGKDFVFQATHVQALVAEVIREFSLPRGRAAPELIMPELPLYVRADPSKIRQAILNVLANAFKYSAAGSTVRIQIEAQPASDAAQSAAVREAPMVCVTVFDQGIGLTPEQLGRVGERFYRANNSGNVPGTGLGMSLVKEIIELHAGQLRISSSLGEGTQVSLCLPRSLPE